MASRFEGFAILEHRNKVGTVTVDYFIPEDSATTDTTCPCCGRGPGA